jgi:nanoRNase/pAp phosphatase (c-di-AMP/oligoRNAs hydrolase)
MGLLDVLQKDAPVALIVHNNPDPDSLASALALRYLLKQSGFARIRVYYDGLVGRAENRAMLRNMKLVLHPTRSIRPVRPPQYVLLDCQPRTGNVTLPKGAQPAAVIDHHPLRRRTRAAFVDVRPHYGACATIVYEYLAGLTPPLPRIVATALFHAISSETQSLGREGSPADRQAYRDLVPRVSFGLLSRIQYPSLSKEFIAHLLGALSRAFYYKNISGAVLDALPYPDFAAEMADFLVRIYKISWSICLGTHEETLYVSLRTSRPGANAGRLIKKIIPPAGTAGGHGQAAGAQVKLREADAVQTREIQELIVRKFIDSLSRARVRAVFNLVTNAEFRLPAQSASGSPVRQDRPGRKTRAGRSSSAKISQSMRKKRRGAPPPFGTLFD